MESWRDGRAQQVLWECNWTALLMLFPVESHLPLLGVMFLHAWAPAIPTVLVKFLPLDHGDGGDLASWLGSMLNMRQGPNGSGFRGMPAPAGALWWIGILLTSWRTIRDASDRGVCMEMGGVITVVALDFYWSRRLFRGG